MPGDGPTTDSVRSTTKEIESKSGSVGSVSSASGGTQGPAIRVVVPGKPDLQIWLQGVPTPLFNAFDKLSKPSSAWKTILKDVVPGLTSLAAVLISLAALVFTIYQRSQAEIQRVKAVDAAQKRVLADLIVTFNGIVVPKDTYPEEQPKLEIAAMRLAAYGDQALPAVRMAFGASNDGVREGGMLVAKQMYRGVTVEHEKLIGEILGFYRTSSPVLQRSVLEWLVQMNLELSHEEAESAVGMLKQGFREKAENCPQDSSVAIQIINFLRIWPSKDSWQLLHGMADSCTSQRVRVLASEEEVKMKKKI